MKAFHVLLFVLFIVLSTNYELLATDYRADTSYPDFGFTSTDVVYDVFVHADGRYLVAGEDFTGGSSVPFLKRYFSNGTLDSSFVSAIQTAGGGSQNYVTDIIKVYPNGQYLVRGRFTAGTFGYWARLNSNGSLDSAVPLTTINAHVRGGQDDGKLLFCGPRVENGVTYNILFRRNADLSFDPTFRITFSDPFNGCAGGYPQPDGKILVTGEFTSGGQPLKRLQRLNADGSVDQTFDPAISAGSDILLLSVLPDGKILVRNFSTMRLLNPDGSQIWANPICSPSIAIFLTDGNFIANGCKKVAGGSRLFDMLRIRADGTPDQSMDYNAISGFEGVKGFREDGNGGLYIYGGISSFDGFNRRGFIRVIPNTTPKKARFDFDGDGSSDVAVFRPSNGVWYLNQSTAGLAYIPWGFSTDRPAAADANQDGRSDIAVFRDGAWHAFTSGTGYHMYMCLGAAGDIPIVGYNHDLGSNRDLYASRGLRGGVMQWFIRGSTFTNCWMSNQQPSATLVPGELVSDKPVVGDFNGDSLDEIGYYRDGQWSGIDPLGSSAPTSYQWGIAGDIPVPGDYDGDRQTDYAVFRPSTGVWWINRSTAGLFIVRWGLNGDIPVPADYDGDGKTDIAVFREGVWWQFLIGSGTIAVQQWGSAGDIPIPAQNQF